jgi:hypothetical protein
MDILVVINWVVNASKVFATQMTKNNKPCKDSGVILTAMVTADR